MPQFDLPLKFGGCLTLLVETGSMLFVLGANGSGKSTLMFEMQKFFGDRSIRLAAHRQLWFPGDAVALSGSGSADAKRKTSGHDKNVTSRFRDGYHHERPMLAVTKLNYFENGRGKEITSAVDSGKSDLALEISRSKPSVLQTLNTILKEANLHVQILITREDEIQVQRGDAPLFNAAQLSDGERGAFLIAAEILTADPGTIFLIDEPERHLHHAISAPLLTSLMQKRKDCAFVVSSHDLILAANAIVSSKLLLRSYTSGVTGIGSWEADLISSNEAVDDVLLRNIIGARRKILFVEGADGSLDIGLYALLFPNVSVMPKGSCGDIIQAVRGARELYNLSWLEVYGLIDEDNRNVDEIAQLESEGIYASKVYSVESLYYGPQIQKYIADLQAQVTGDDASGMIERARAATLQSLASHKVDLCCRVLHNRIRYNALSQVPKRHHILKSNDVVQIVVDVPEMRRLEIQKFDSAIDARDVEVLIRNYPVRHSQALDEICKSLGFSRRDKYESAVRKLVSDNIGVLSLLRNMVGPLSSKLAQQA